MPFAYFKVFRGYSREETKGRFRKRVGFGERAP